jgi:hypothetical protein
MLMDRSLLDGVKFSTSIQIIFRGQVWNIFMLEIAYNIVLLRKVVSKTSASSCMSTASSAVVLFPVHLLDQSSVFILNHLSIWNLSTFVCICASPFEFGENNPGIPYISCRFYIQLLNKVQS